MLKIPQELLQSVPNSEVANKENFYCSHHPCSMSFKTAFCFFSAILKCSRYLLQLLPRAGLNLCHQSSTHHYGSINALLGMT